MFKDKLKDLRTKKKLTQEELAKEIFVSRAAVSKWERGIGIPSGVNLETICKYFNVDVDFLLDKDDLLMEVEKLKISKENVKSYLPILISTIFFLIISFSKIFVFIRKGLYKNFSGYYPNLSILDALEEFSLIPIGIYLFSIFLNILLLGEKFKLNVHETKMYLVFNWAVILFTLIFSFLVSWYLVEPYNYGLFWFNNY